MRNVSALYTFAIMKGENRQLRELANMSFPLEDWSGIRKPSKNVDEEYFTLWNYIHNTFNYLYHNERSKVFQDNNYSCFNTGLETKTHQEIFAFFIKNQNDGKFHFEGYVEDTDNRLNAIRSKLPDPANYIINVQDFIYDPKNDEDYSLSHIFERQERLPRVILTIPEEFREDVIVNRMRMAFKRLKRNYKLAIPQYSPRLKEIQLLVPLCIKDKLNADCALAVQKIDGVYVAKTILTMDMAYNNARLITRPDGDWLKLLNESDGIDEDDLLFGDIDE